MQKMHPPKPLICKLATIGCNYIVETTPVVFHGELYRFEVVREKTLPVAAGWPVSQNWQVVLVRALSMCAAGNPRPSFQETIASVKNGVGSTDEGV